MKRKLLCLLLALALGLFCLPLGMAEELPETVYISTAQDFLAFAEHCRLDSWSVGRTVVLQEDISLLGTGFSGIASFSGTFLGNRHTISNLNLTHGEGAVGLFRYLEASGRVENLTVTGLVKSGNSADTLGGIAGVNAGVISGCTFSGTLKAMGTAGGIAGLNGETGKIELCVNTGTVTSENQVGGIVGRSFGLIADCYNQGEVNSDSSWVDNMQEDESASLLSGLTGGRDIGGIAGRSSGAVVSCHNTGVVGYRMSGQNVGGIVGSMSGSLTDCTNDGLVRGSQSVGGIAGHLEPELALEKAEDIRREVERLHDILDRTVRDLDALTDDLHADVDGLLTTTGAISDTTKALADELVEVINGNLEAVNGLSDRAAYVIRHLPGVLDGVDSALTGLRAANGDLNDILNDFDLLEQIEADPEDREAFAAARAQLEAAQTGLNASLEQAEALAQELRQLLKQGDFCLDTLARLVKDITALKKALSDAETAAQQMAQAGLSLARVLQPYLEQLPGEVGDHLDALSCHVDDSLSGLQSTVRDAAGILRYLGALDTLKAVQLSEEFTQNGDVLSARIQGLVGNLRQLSDHLDIRSDALERDLRDVNDQLNKILGMILDRLDQLEERAEGLTLWEDCSVREPERVSASRMGGARNSGRVEGGTAVGGIVGSVQPEARELLDEKPAITQKYQAYAVVEQCESIGFLTVKGSNGGGIAGSLETGLIRDCFASGGISGVNADYLGGILGSGGGTVEGCSSLAQLRGHRYLGGIAGTAGAIRNCLSMASIPEYDSRVGAIAGALPSEGEDETAARGNLNERLSGNRFVSSALGGVDGISYQDAAQPVSYESLLASGSLPSAFTHLEVVFVDEDGQVLRRTELPYGADLTSLEYPQLALADNSYADWEQPATATMEGSIILRAGAAANVTILSSREKLLGKALALAEGVFTQEAALTAADSGEAPPAGLPENASAHVRTLTLENTGLSGSSALRVRLLQEDSGTATVFALRDGVWEELPSETVGQYLQVEMTGAEQTFCIVTQPPVDRWKVLALPCAGGAAALAVLGLVFRRKKRSSKNTAQ